MLKFAFLISILTFIAHSLFATIISGNNPEYAGEKLEFKMYSDPVTKNEIPAFSIQFDNQGNFQSDFPVNKTTYVFCDFGIYRGMLFIEPNKTIEILFPPVREKSFADEKNPFFEPVTFWFNLKNDEGINHQVSAFEIQFNQLTNKYFNQLYFRQSREMYDSVVYKLNQEFPKQNSELFEAHKKLKLKVLETDVFRMEANAASELVSTVSSDFWNTPAFINYFEKLFTNRLSFDAKESQGAEIKKAVGLANVGFLQNHVKTKYKVTGHSIDLALLKMIQDAFFSGEFSKNSILKILQSDNLLQNSSSKIREITAIIIEKLELLLPGTNAPVICLKDINGNKHCSNETSGKFKYLVFADAEMMVCQEQLKYLSKIDEMFQEHLEIILIMRKTDIIEMKIFLDKNQVPGLKLVDENNEVIEMYRIKSFPTCILLNENHKVQFETAKAPLDGFEQQFGTFLKNELFRRQRNQGR